MSLYQSINPTLSNWAEANSVRWFVEYQDVEVRTFYLRPNSRGRVQVWVEAPHNGETMVRVSQNPGGLSRLNKRADLPTSVVSLSETLDRALRLANEWLAEEEAG